MDLKKRRFKKKTRLFPAVPTTGKPTKREPPAYDARGYLTKGATFLEHQFEFFTPHFS